MTGLISTDYRCFQELEGKKNHAFFSSPSLFRSAAHGHVFCMPSRYDQKGTVAFPRSLAQLKVFVYLAFLASLYVAVFIFGAALGQMVCQS